jgi:hypothetical protein
MMGIVCPNCQHENKTEAAFCVKCGTQFTTNLPEAVHVPKKKRRGWLIGSIIFFVILIGLVIAYFLLARPYLEDQIFVQLDSAVSGGFYESEYYGGVMLVTITEDEVNEIIDTFRDESSNVVIDRIRFEQDDIVMLISLFDRFQIEYHFDFRADSSGQIVIQDSSLPKVNYLLFEKQNFINWIESTINENFIEDGNVKLMSIQVSENQMFYVYDSQD